jgi:hypothetical protein
MKRERYLQLIEPAMAIVVKKHEDYGNDRRGLHSFFPFGAVSYVQMLHVKTQRLVSLVENGQAPNFESIEDTLLDSINYSVFMLDYLNQKKEPKK